MDDTRIPKQILKWTPIERRKRGRLKATCMGGIQKVMSERDLQPGDWEERLQKLSTKKRTNLTIKTF